MAMVLTKVFPVNCPVAMSFPDDLGRPTPASAFFQPLPGHALENRGKFRLVKACKNGSRETKTDTHGGKLLQTFIMESWPTNLPIFNQKHRPRLVLR